MAKMERVPEDSKERCQSVFAGGQCPYKREPHSEYCIMHGGNKAAEAIRKRASHDYKLQTWQERVDDLAGSQHVKNLRGEIGILRMALENIINLIKTPQQFPIFSDKIQSLARDLKGLIEVAQKIEERNKELLSKTEVFNIADAVINILAKYITDPDEMLAVGEEIHAAIIGVVSGQNPIGS